MKHINSLVDLQKKKLGQSSKNSQIGVGLNDSRPLKSKENVSQAETDYQAENELDHAGAIGKIFANFEYAYHNQFHKAFPDAEDLVIAKKYWLSSLERYSPAQIVQAAKKVIETQEYLPSIAAIIKACEQGLDLFGLPFARQAYIEACSAPSPKKEHNWSHEAVYHAGNAAGWYLLANHPETTALPVFEYHYSQLCKRVIAGEQLSIEIPTPLPDKIDHKLDREEARARIAKLKRELGL